MIEASTRERLIFMLTQRMRWARQMQDIVGEGQASRMSTAADEEVRGMIREIARICRFDNECIDAITGPAWSASKEDA